MAGRTVTREDIQAAAKAYCEATGMICSEGEDKKIRLIKDSPGDNDPLVWEEAGQLKTNNPEFGLEFREYLDVVLQAKAAPRVNVPARPQDVAPKGEFDMANWRARQAKTYSVAGKNAPNAFAVSEEANKRRLCTQIMDSGRTKDLVWGHVRVTDPATGQYREDRVSHEKETFVLLKAWEDANSQAKFQKGLIIGISDNSMPELNPDIRIKGMPAQLWLTMQVMRSWSMADRDAVTKAERRAQLKIMNREWRDDGEIVLEQEEERAVQDSIERARA